MHSHVHRQPLMYLFILRKNTQLYIIGCKTRCLFCNLLIFSIYRGETGNVTSDSFSDIYRPTGVRWHSSCWAW